MDFDGPDSLDQPITLELLQLFLDHIAFYLENLRAKDPLHYAPPSIWDESEKSSMQKINQLLQKTHIDTKVTFQNRKARRGRTQSDQHRNQKNMQPNQIPKKEQRQEDEESDGSEMSEKTKERKKQIENK